tara:strand:- start:3671 stop:4402 length:732 start_codon:yes stop_codon:yes gene_type:complete
VRHLKRNLLSLLSLPLVTLALAASPAQAVLVSQSDVVFGADSVTLDTNTGLKWLDVNISANRSFNDVSGQLGTGGDFQGWRYATGAEVLNLIVSNTVPLAGSPTPGSLTVGSASDFIVTLGSTFIESVLVSPTTQSNVFGVTGIYAGNLPGEYGLGSVGMDGVTDTGVFGPLFQNAQFGVADNVGASPFEDADTQFSDRGSWLVFDDNATVQMSAPGVLAIFGIVIAGIAFSRRPRGRLRRGC